MANEMLTEILYAKEAVVICVCDHLTKWNGVVGWIFIGSLNLGTIIFWLWTCVNTLFATPSNGPMKSHAYQSQSTQWYCIIFNFLQLFVKYFQPSFGSHCCFPLCVKRNNSNKKTKLVMFDMCSVHHIVECIRFCCFWALIQKRLFFFSFIHLCGHWLDRFSKCEGNDQQQWQASTKLRFQITKLNTIY